MVQSLPSHFPLSRSGDHPVFTMLAPSWSAAGWIIFQGPNGIYRADPSTATADTPPTFHRDLYSDAEEAIYGAPAWSY